MMSREDELKRQAQYGSADGVLRICGPDSLCMLPNNLCMSWVCVGDAAFQSRSRRDISRNTVKRIDMLDLS